MQETWHDLSPEHPRQLDLTSRGLEQIFTAYHEVDALQPVVDDDRELIGPVAGTVAHEKVAALC